MTLLISNPMDQKPKKLLDQVRDSIASFAPSKDVWIASTYRNIAGYLSEIKIVPNELIFSSPNSLSVVERFSILGD